MTRHTSHLTRHTSHDTPHTSHLPPPTSHYKPHTSHVTRSHVLTLARSTFTRSHVHTFTRSHVHTFKRYDHMFTRSHVYSFTHSHVHTFIRGRVTRFASYSPTCAAGCRALREQDRAGTTSAGSKLTCCCVCRIANAQPASRIFPFITPVYLL